MRMKRIIAAFMALGMTIAELTACGTTDDSEEAEVSSINIIIWGSTYSEEAFEDFEEETGIKVNVSYIDNTDTIISKLIEGGTEYDVIYLESAYVQTFVENDLLAELNKDNITNWDNIEDTYNVGTLGDEDMVYTCPSYAPGYTGIIYNTETCPIEITRFSDLADPALKGEIAMVNSTISLYGAALVDLGYEADSCDEAELAEANELLKEIKENVKAFVGSSAVSVLESGECSVAFSWDYSTLCFDSEENWDKFAMVDLESGCEYFSGFWAVPSISKKQEAAEEFINFMLRPEECATCYTEYGWTPLLKRELIEEYLPDGFYDNPAITISDTLQDKAWVIAVNDEQIGIMDTLYTELMGNE